MPEYVYALHDFAPEHEDEIHFRAGERIEVVEKDDQYGDGWWTGRNLEGKVGLFPQSYTAPAPAPSAKKQHVPNDPQSAQDRKLQSLDEESDLTPNATPSIEHTDGEVMQATMTDVQKAIEQLGKHDRDGARSFSFASGDLSSDRDSDIDGTDEVEGEGEHWHRDARQKLAEEARKANEKRAAAEAKEAALAQSHIRISAPPIEVEMSDESEPEDEDEGAPLSAFRNRRHSHITEEEEGSGSDNGQARVPAENVGVNVTNELYVPVSVSNGDESETQTATARRANFPSGIYPPVDPATPSAATTTPETKAPPTPTSPTMSVPPFTDSVDLRRLSGEKPAQDGLTSLPAESEATALPSPAASSIGALPSQYIVAPHTPAKSTHTTEPELAPPLTSGKYSSVHPSEWTVEDVVEWLKAKGFDQAVCDKFIEQEITGDVLLELDVNLLKSEIGIAAFGKRVRIANAITELRRPPSVASDNQQVSHIITHVSQHPQQMSAHSHSHSFQSTGTSGGYSMSPATPATMATNMSGPPELVGMSSLTSPESPPNTGDMRLQGRRDSDGGARSLVSVNVTDTDKIGLGLSGASESTVNGKTQKNRPANLSLSPSDSALEAESHSIDQQADSGDNERAVMSEGESPSVSAKSKRRRMFGRSTYEPATAREKEKETRRHSRDGSVSPGAPKRESDELPRHTKGKRSVDGTKSSDRLSLFGGTFSGTLGKSRKPPPRYSIYGDVPDSSAEKSHTGLSKIYGGKRSSGRPSTSDGSSHSGNSKEKEKEKTKSEIKDAEKKPAERLRKRTMSSSTPNDAARRPSLSGPSQLKPGQSVLEQIGTPDFEGWMRKKGDSYNTWKLRYFILKGPHLYYMKSNSSSETKIKGYINIVGYKVVADENANPGRYGFRIVHDNDKTHYFSSEEQTTVREWMKALMKATIGRDYTKPVVSSFSAPTIPLTVAQAMNPAPRPPSPTARAATQKSFRRENPNQLSSRDARILMGLGPDGQETDNVTLGSFFSGDTASLNSQDLLTTPTPKSSAPPRPSRELRRTSTVASARSERNDIDQTLIDWANSRLPRELRITDPTISLCGGLGLLRIAEAIKGAPSSPPVPDTAFPKNPNDDKLDGLFRLFDFLLDNEVKLGTVSINDVRQGKREKIIQLLKALKAWDDRRKAASQSVSKLPSTAFMAPTGLSWGHL